MKRLTMMLGLLCMGASEARDPELPGWMAGCWLQEQGERWTEECWTAPRGGMMMGSSRTGRGDETVAWETMRIVKEAAGGMTYRASPGGAHPTIFSWQAAKESGVTFLNATHDYPQRIRYWREGELLMAEISLADGGKPRRWVYKRLG